MDWRSLLSLIRYMQKESGRGFFDLFRDMQRCYETRGFTWRNYATFGFHMLTEEKIRDTYISQSETDDIRMAVNTPESYAVLRDKAKAANIFKPFYGREFFDVREEGPDAFDAFLKRHDVVFCKYISNMLSRGIERIVTKDVVDSAALHARLLADRKFLVEEGVVQHPEMAKLSLQSVNTMRICTCRDLEGKVSVPYITLRANLVEGYYDNTAFKGAWSPIKNFKSVTFPFVNNSRKIVHFTEHPQTKFPFIGFEIPFIEESIQLVQDACECLPEARMIGWDIAITPTGPVIIEANYTPTPEYYQIYGMMENDLGYVEKLEKALGIPITRPHRAAAGIR